MTSNVQNAVVAPAVPMPPLSDYRDNVHSQFGEDGIIAEILRRTGLGSTRPMWCVELGAWDGFHLSNTRHLIESRNANAVLIEAHTKRFAELVANSSGNDLVTTLHARVEATGAQSLDGLLEGTACPARFDILSLDIDGHDYWVWHGMTRYRPSIVVIEYMPTIPFGVSYIQPRGTKRRDGSSLCAMADLGREKGYTLVAVTDVNAILVDEALVDSLGLADASISALTKDLPDYRTYLFQTHSGEIGIAGHRHMNWHGTTIHLDRIQALPWYLRRHPDDMGPIRQFLLGLYRKSAKRRMRRWFAADAKPAASK